MSVRSVGWTVSLGVAALGAGFAAFVRLADDDTKQRTAASLRLLRERAAASLQHLSEQTVRTAGDLREQWTGTANDVRDRWTETAETARTRAEDWRERSSESIERRIREAAEARDDSLDTGEDDSD